jgi:hypothetical protein
MTQYLLSVYQPAGGTAPPEILEPVKRNVAVLNKEMRDAGAWVFAGGLHDPSTATMARLTNGEVLMTDGPFTEGKEVLGGICIIEAADLDAALEWAAKLTRATTLPIEVRPFLESH